MTGQQSQPKANAQLLTLAKGLYRLSVTSGTAGGAHPSGVPMPAVQVSAGPGAPANSIDFMTSRESVGAWLFEGNNTVIARIKVESSPIFITSYSIDGADPLQIEIEQVDSSRSLPAKKSRPGIGQTPNGSLPLDLGKAGGRGGPALIGSSSRRVVDGRPTIPVKVLAHISRKGDVVFVDQPMVGFVEEKLQIEGFSIEPIAGLGVADIEYKTLSEKGVESPWTVGGVFSGTKQMALALSGFAIRLKGPKAQSFECRYSGVFKSGVRIGPASDGAPLHSGRVDDPLVGIEVALLEGRTQAMPAAPVFKAGQAPPAQNPQSAAPASGAQGPRMGGQDPALRPPIGPRFSIYRDDDD